MRIRLAALGVLAALAAGCGSTPTAQETASTTTGGTTPVSPKPLTLTVFRFEGGVLRPNVAHVPFTTTPAAAALAALGLDGTVTLSGGTAHVDVPAVTPDQTAEIVLTLTQFSTVQRVDVGDRKGLTRDDFASSLPPILVESPAAGATVAGRTFTVSGTASVFEATLVVELVRDGKVVEKQSVTASEGAPGRGSFTTTLHGTPGDATVKAFAPSAADGHPQHEVDVPITIRLMRA